MAENIDIFSMIGTKAEDLKTDTPKVEKKPAEKAQEKEIKENDSSKKYTAPFHVYFSGSNHDENGMFEDGKQYTGAEITKIMLQHRFFEFSGEVGYDYDSDSNTVIAMFVQHKKG